ncbi:MAG: GcvT family protein [Candidatus Puniceispirillaceae bacterium]
MAEISLPSHASVVIIGGGVIGCSVAYHLAELGWTDIVLLERKQLTCGTTWHAAGLIAQLRATQNMTRLAKYSQELYAGLEAKTGVATGFRQNGSITVALTDARLEELRRGAAMARAFGVEIDEISASEIAQKYPGLNVSDAKGGVYLDKDGQADPVNITQSLAKGARAMGVKIIEGVAVTDILNDGELVTGVTTPCGNISADYVVNCGGMWARQIGQMAGVSVPLHACEHFYIVTEQIPDLQKNLPVLRVPDECAYYKEDAGKILLGAFEPVAKPWGGDGISEDFEFTTLPDDFDHFEPILEQAVNRLPVLEQAGIQTFFNGPESFTPDDRYMLGEAPELKRFFVAAGFNSVGIQSAGGAGMALAQWIDRGRPQMDIWDVDIRRVHPFQSNRHYLSERVSETLGLLYADHFPYRQFATSRGIRKTPLHNRLAEHGACFGELYGWERANWFLPKEEAAQGKIPEYEYSWKRQNWFDYAKQEHLGVRNHAGLFDLSTFGKIKLVGKDAEAVLQRICANNVATEPGKIIYTQWLNDAGGIEADVTVTRLAEDEYLIVTPAATIRRELSWLKRHIPDDAHCFAVDMTVSEAVIAVMGPKSRDILQPLIDQSLGNDDFAFGTAQDIHIAQAMARAHRVSYVGELGWEIYVSSEMAEHVFDAIYRSGEAHNMRLCGMHVLDSCRIEKAFRHFGHDISDEDNVLEAGLGFAVKLDKPASRFGDFIGRDAVQSKKQNGLQKRLVQFKLTDPELLLYHNEPILRDGKIVGYLTSGNYGHHLGGAIGLGYVPCHADESAADMLSSSYQIDVAGDIITAEASLKPMYDPTSERTKG